jgi:hypothetical protein
MKRNSKLLWIDQKNTGFITINLASLNGYDNLQNQAPTSSVMQKTKLAMLTPLSEFCRIVFQILTMGDGRLDPFFWGSL